MGKRAIIRHGDRTTHGGTVVTSDPTYVLYGKNVARVNDRVSCPQCNGTYPIVTGAPDVWTGQQIARQDDVTSCGAKLIASQYAATIDNGAQETEALAAPAAAAALAHVVAEDDEIEETRVLRFQALDPDSGDPCPECVYILTREDGVTHGGITDPEGYIEVIETTRPEQIAVHFMFQSPKGDRIDRGELEV